MLQLPMRRKQSESYALEMRKVLYTDSRSNFHNSRKRNYFTISKVFNEQKVIELNSFNRKILIPRKKYLENLYLNDVKKPDKTYGEETKGNNGSEKVNDGDEIISPIDVKKAENVNSIFTTSTPILKRSHMMSTFSPQLKNQLITAPLDSIIEGNKYIYI